jgi:hypothetical protein
VRPSAEQTVKVPLQPLQGSGDLAKRDKNSVSSIFHNFSHFHLIFPIFLHSESVQAPRTMADSAVSICTANCTLMCRDYSKIQKFFKKEPVAISHKFDSFKIHSR